MPALVVLDVDGTLTTVRSSWQYLHERLGIWQGKAEKYQEMFQKGEISYLEFCVLDGLLWEGIPLEEVMSIISEIPYRDGVEEFFGSLREENRSFALVSTGLSFLVHRVQDDFDVEYAFSNRLLSNGSHLTGEVEVAVDWNDKGKIVKKLKEKLGISKEEVAVFGDSEGDVDMFDAGGYCVAVAPTSKALRERAHLVLEDGDLKRGAKYLMGRKR